MSLKAFSKPFHEQRSRTDRPSLFGGGFVGGRAALRDAAGLASASFAFALTLWGSCVARAEVVQTAEIASLRHVEKVDAWYADWRTSAQEHAHRWAARGVWADREKRTVTVFAEATGLSEGNPVEFFLIGATSGHDYEALAISYARPRDVHAALEFIGIPAGAPFSPRARRFFPKGERVLVDFEWVDEAGQAHRWNAHELIFDARTRQSLDGEFFVFVGSARVQHEGEEVYAADRIEPQSILSLYNEPGTVFDRPRIANQQALYGSLEPYPGRQPAAGQWLTLHIRPELPAGQLRVVDVQLEVAMAGEHEGLALMMRDREGTPLNERPTLTGVLAGLNRLVEQDRTPHLTLQMDDQVPLKEIQDLLIILEAAEREALLHMEPPSTDTLFYRAFLPNEEHRERAARPSQVLELRLDRAPADGRVEVLHVLDEYDRREMETDVEKITYPVASKDDLPQVLEQINHRLPVLLVFAPSEMTYGTLMDWVRPVLATHSTIFIFLNH